MMIHRNFTDLDRLPTFLERYEYLRLNGEVGTSTFGFDRHLNQMFYRSHKWKMVRRDVVARDAGCDLAHADHPIPDGDSVLVHHMNPVTIDDLVHQEDWVLDPEYLITVTHRTHNAIHFGDDRHLRPVEFVTREPGDTTLW